MKKNSQNLVKITAALILIAFTVIADATIENILKNVKLGIAFAYKVECVAENSDKVILLFGTCNDPEEDNVNVYFPPGGPFGTGAFPAYFHDNPENAQVLFYENNSNAEWTLSFDSTMIVTFIESGVVPVNDTLELFDGESKIDDISDGKEFVLSGDKTKNYKIVYTHLEKSVTPKSITYTFQPGWNLLHFPIIVYEDDRRENDNWDILNNLQIFAFDGKNFSKKEKINCGDTFWVFYKEDEIPGNQLIVLGYDPLNNELPKSKTGWNFAGKSLNKQNYETKAIFEWSNKKYHRIISEETPDETKGYWINLTN